MTRRQFLWLAVCALIAPLGVRRSPARTTLTWTTHDGTTHARTFEA